MLRSDEETYLVLQEVVMDRTFTQSQDFVQRDVAGECLLVPLRRQLSDGNSIFVLNETGAALWRRLDGSRSVQEIMEDLSQEFDVTREQLEQDVPPLIEDLLSIEAIRQVQRE